MKETGFEQDIHSPLHQSSLTPRNFVLVQDVAEPPDALLALLVLLLDLLDLLPLPRQVVAPGLYPPEEVPERGLLPDPGGRHHHLPQLHGRAETENLRSLARPETVQK